MRDLIERFIAVMEDVQVLHKELLDKAADKRAAVSGRQLQALDKLVREEQTLLARQAELERRRTGCVRELCERTGSAPEDTTMLTIAALGDAEQSARLHSLAEKLKETLNQLRQVNDINSRLIENRLEYIDCMVEGNRSLSQPPAAYSARGADLRQRDSSKLYDKKV